MLLIYILVIIILVYIRAIYASADVAFANVNKSKIKQMAKEHNKKAIRIENMMEDTTKFFGTITIIATFIEFFISSFSAGTFLIDLQDSLSFIPLSNDFVMFISMLLITIILSYITLVFGILLPKKIAKAYPEKTTFFIINHLWYLSKIIYPIEVLLHFSTKVFSKLFGIKDTKQEKITEKDVKMFIAESKDEGAIDQREKKLIYNVLRIDNIQVKDMVKKIENVDLLSINATKKEILKNIRDYKFTRIPIYKDTKENIIGILNIKDILLNFSSIDHVDISKIIRPAFFINEEEKLETAFNLMQLNNQSIAVIRNKDNINIGIITLEDILEKIVGDIFDEYDITT